LVAALALVLCVGLPVGEVQAQETQYKLKFATVAPAGTPWSKLLKKYKKSVEKASGGKIKVKLFLGGLKGDEQSIVRQVFKGSGIQAGGVSTGAMATLVPEMDVLELPYLFGTAKEADRILAASKPLIEEILEKKGFKLIMYSENGYRSIGSKGSFVRSPADLKAKKMRSQESAVHTDMWRSLGASPVTISVGEVLSSLQTGVVEGFDNTPLFTQAVGWNQAVDHFTMTRHIYQPAMLVVNKKWFDALPADLQTAMFARVEEWESKGRRLVRALEKKLLENFDQMGVKVYEPTAAELGAFKKATRPVWDQRRKRASAAGKKLLDSILSSRGGK